MSNPETIAALATSLVEGLTAAKLTLATAESCTGGWVAKSLTDVAGSSACFGFGIVSYSNTAKQRLLKVAAETLEAHGAVSEQTVVEMAEGAQALSGADLAVAVSGIAGPGGGSPEKPVGQVWFAWSGGAIGDAKCAALSCQFSGDRETVRRQAVEVALRGLLERIPGG